MSQVLQSLSNANLVTALESNMFAFWANYGRAPHREVYEGSDLLQVTTNIPFPLFNGIFRAQLKLNQIDTTIEKIIHYYNTQQLPMFWWTGPATQPLDLGTYLEAHGLIPKGELPCMAIDLSSLPEQIFPSELAIAQVKDAEALKHYVQVGMIGFGIPEEIFNAFFELELSLGFNDSQHIRYIGYSKGSPVATSALYLNSGVAGIYFVATIPEARLQGFATAMVLAALQEASNLGYQIGTLQAAPMGVSVYRRIGFQEYCKIGVYLWDGKSPC